MRFNEVDESDTLGVGSIPMKVILYNHLTMSHKEILTAALALPENIRANLVDRLLQSLEPGEHSEINGLWAREAESRIRAYERGELGVTSSVEVFAALRSRHASTSKAWVLERPCSQ